MQAAHCDLRTENWGSDLGVGLPAARIFACSTGGQWAQRGGRQDGRTDGLPRCLPVVIAISFTLFCQVARDAKYAEAVSSGSGFATTGLAVGLSHNHETSKTVRCPARDAGASR